MVKKRTYIILIAVLIIFLIIMFLVFGSKNIKKGGYTSIFILGNSTVWKYSNNDYYNITYKSSFQKLSWNSYDIYSNNEKIGNYYLWYNDKWYVFDKEKNPINVSGDFIAIKSNYGLKLKDFSQENVTDFSYVNMVLEDNGLSEDSEFTSIYKIDFDIDSDSKSEEFYIISNAFAMDFVPEKTFNIAFTIKNNSLYYIYKDVTDNKNFNGCMPYYNAFIDFDNDGVSEFVLSCAKYSNLGQIDMLYQYKDNAFKILISNQ